MASMDPMNLAIVRLDDSLRIIHCGYLWKLSRSVVPTTAPGCASALVSKWSRRFFLLRADACLYFFKKDQVPLKCTILLNRWWTKIDHFAFQEIRPLGATLISGCTVIPGCDEEDIECGVSRDFAFRLKLSRRGAPGDIGVHQESVSGGYLCLATDNQQDLDQWIHSISHIAQNPEQVSSNW